ncbi:MAG: LPP20 family lipoprotein [Rickettsiales bacterium]|nr:LPP20 family lipoprotein [Rickettsiales bacterium]
MKKILKLTFFILITSCVSKIDNAEIPKWYLSPPKNNIENLYGVGVGSKDQAVKFALNNISEKILVTISSDYSQNISEAKLNNLSEYESRVSQNIDSNTLSIEYSNYEVEKTANISDKTYVLVSVSRQEIANKYISELRNNNKEITSLYKSLQKEIPVRKLIIINKIKPLIHKQKLNIKLLNSLTKDNDFTANYLDFYQEIKEEEIKIKKDALINIISKPSDSRIANALSEALNKSGFNVSYKEENNNNVILRISTKTIHQEIYGSHMVKINLNLKLIENYGKQIAEKNIELKGSSRLNSSAAIDSAIKDLNKKISESDIFTILGI